jgi:hypothetical protein
VRLLQQGSVLTPVQNQVDAVVGGFVDQATDWKSLAAMTAGGMAYRMGRIGMMSTRIGAPLQRVASIGIGLGAEVTAFEMTSRSLASLTGENHSNPHLWHWNGQGGIRQGLLASLITFGSLKGAGRSVQGQNFLIQHLVQDGAMVLGHNASAAFGITSRPTGSLAEQFLHAEATNLQLGAGMALGHAVTGGGIHSLERGLDLSLRGMEVPLFPLAGTQRFRDALLLSGLMGLNSGCDSHQGIADPSDRLFWTGLIMGGAYGVYRILRRWVHQEAEERYHGLRPGEIQLDHLRALRHPREMRYRRATLGEIGLEIEISPPTKPTNPPKIFDLFLDPRSGKVVESYELISPQPYAPPPEPDHTGLIHARIGTRIDIHQFADLLKRPVLSLPLLGNLHDRSRDYEIAFHSEDILSERASAFPWAGGEWVRLLEKPPVGSKEPLSISIKDRSLRPGDRIDHAGLSFRWLPPRKGSPVQEYAWTLLVPKIEDLRKEWMDLEIELDRRKESFRNYIALLNRVPEQAEDFLQEERRAIGNVWKVLPDGMGVLYFEAVETINKKLYPEDFQKGEEDEALILKAPAMLNTGTEESEAPSSGIRSVDRVIQFGRWAEVRRLNERILQGDMEAVRQGRVHYSYMDESISGNARLPNHIAVNTYVDPDSGQIVAVGNMQNLSVEAIEGKVKVTFRVRILPQKITEAMDKDFTPTITDGMLSRPVLPEVKAVLESLIGKPFYPAREDYFPDPPESGSGQDQFNLAFLIGQGSMFDGLLHHVGGSIHPASDKMELVRTVLLAVGMIAMAYDNQDKARASLSLAEVKGEIVQARPLSAGRARFLMEQIVSPKNEEPTLERYQALWELSRRADFQDFPALFGAVDQLGKQERPIDFWPLVESLWGVLGTSYEEVGNRLVYLEKQEKLQTLFKKSVPKGFAVLPIYNAIQMSEGPLDLEDLLEKMSRPAVAHGILRTEIYRTVADDPRLKSHVVLQKILRGLKETGRLFQEAKFYSMELGSTLFNLLNNPHFSGKKNIQDVLDLLPFAMGPGTGMGPPRDIVARLIGNSGFRFRDHEKRILQFVRTELVDPSDRISFLGGLGPHPKLEERSLQRLLKEILQYEQGTPPNPHSAGYERYVKLTQQIVGAMGQIGSNPNFTHLPFLIHKIRAAKTFPLVKAGALALIMSNPSLKEAQDFRDIIDGIFATRINQEALEVFLKICLGNRRMPKKVRDELWGRLGMEDPPLLARLFLYHQSLGAMN